MSMNKKMVGGFVGLMMFAIAATALAAGGSGQPGPTPVPTVISPGPIMTAQSVCPQGWHLKPGTKSGNVYACTPTKTPSMIECPTGMVYVDNGCSIGCEPAVK